MEKLKKYWPELLILIISLMAFLPAFWGRIPLNARNLVAFFSPWHYEKYAGFPAGVPSKPGMLDQLRIYYPYMALTQREYRSGNLPLWNPYNFAGNPHMAEWQSGVFYPLQILLLILPLPAYWTIFQIVGFFLTGLFTYWYLKNLGVRKAAGFFGAVSFMLSSFMTTWNMEVVVASHSILWLPLILLAVDKVIGITSSRARGLQRVEGFSPEGALSARSDINNDRKKWWLVGLFSLVFSILSGYWQTTFYVMAVSIIYAVYRSIFKLTELKIKNLKLKIPKLTLSILAWFPISLSLTVFHLLPTWELYQHSGRLAVNSLFETKELLLGYLLPLRQMVTLWFPDFYGHPTTRNYFASVRGTYYEHALFVGTLVMIFGLLGLLVKKMGEGKSLIKFWFLSGVLAASFTFNMPWARLVYYLNLPVLSTGIPNRILFIPAFALCVLAAYGLDWLINSKKIEFLLLIILALLSDSFLLGLIVWLTKSSLGVTNLEQMTYMISLRNMVLPILILLLSLAWVLIFRIEKKWFGLIIGGLAGISLGQQLYQHYKFTAFSETQFVYPSHSTIKWLQDNAGINRFIGYNGQYMNNNFATYYGIYAIEGYDSLNDYRRSALLYSTTDGLLHKELSRSDAMVSYDLDSPYLIKLLRLMGVKYFIEYPIWLDYGSTAGKPRLPETDEKLLFTDGDWKIWEYQKAMPRAFMVGRYEIAADGQQILDRFYSDDFDPENTVLLIVKPPEGFNFSESESRVEVESYRPTKAVFKTKSDSDQLLVISDTYYPGWRARLENGKEVPILRADYALRAIAIPAGEHTVTMWYLPNSFKKGLMISFITVITVIIFIKNIKIKL